MTTSSRNTGVANMAIEDGDEEMKAYVKQHYNLDPSLTSWDDIDNAAKAAQREQSRREKGDAS